MKSGSWGSLGFDDGGERIVMEGDRDVLANGRGEVDGKDMLGCSLAI